MRLLHKRSGLAVLGAFVVLIMLATAGPAAAVTLNGDWAPFNRCPVDDSTMLAADGSANIAWCTVSDSPSGSMTLGNTTVATGDSNVQFGLIENTASGIFSADSPSGSGILGAPVQIPGGLLGLMCPSNIPVVSQVCNQITNSSLNQVTATVQPAGTPSNFSLAAVATTGQAILTLPVKVQLGNPLLGPNCYIGSDSDPIVLHPKNLVSPSGSHVHFNADGTPNNTSGVMYGLSITGTLTDTSFAVPGANGCGLLGILDGALDLKTGLPAPTGNSLVLNNNVMRLAGLTAPASAVPNDGRDLSNYWHSAATS